MMNKTGNITEVITLFNKNGISIKKIRWNHITKHGAMIDMTNEDPEGILPRVCYICSCIQHYDQTKYETKSQKGAKYNKKDECRRRYREIKKESPLGFYYYQREYENPALNTASSFDYLSPKKKQIISKEIRQVMFAMDPTWCYTITYLVEHNGQKVDKETRPWDLLDGNFPDNFMNGLLNQVNGLFDEIESVKLATGRYYSSVDRYRPSYNSKTPREIRRMVITDLFGDPRGPRFQTNDEKILAHGFDLKTSFRKM